MSNVALFNPSQVPSFVRKGELSDIAKALAGGGAGQSGERISIKGGVFRLLSGGKEIAAIEERYLDVVIVKAAPKVARTFYMKKYDGETAASPDCWSNDGETPDAKSKNPQSDTCNGCTQNIAGSGTGNSRACRYQQRLAVVLANDIEGSVKQLALPATSLFGKEVGEDRPLQAYARWLVAQGVDPSTVVTRMKFDTKAEAPKLFFKAMRWLTDEEYAEATKQGESEDAKRAVVMNVAAQDSVAPANPLGGTPPKASIGKRPANTHGDIDAVPDIDDEPPAPAPKASKTPKTAPVADADEEPTVKKEEKKPSAVPGKKDLASVVADWDDE
jgi:hypothetical protein